MRAGADWQAYLRPRAALLGVLVVLLLGFFTFSVQQARQTFQEASVAQARLAQAARTARDVQRLEFLAAELSGWLGQYALDVNLGGSPEAAQNVYAQSFGATLSEMTALLRDLREGANLPVQEQVMLQSIATNVTQLSLMDGLVRDAYSRRTHAGVREGTALVRGEAFTTYQALSGSASALSRRVVQQAELEAQQAERTAQLGSRRMLSFTLGSGLLLLLLAGLVVEVLRKREQVVGQLRDLAHRDGLTGLANRRRWDELLAVQAAEARRSGWPLSVMLLDLDHFKAFNDTHGHQAGDEQLRAVARVLTGGLASGGLGAGVRGAGVLVARYGGEEFSLLFPGLSPRQARERVDALRGQIPSGGTFSAGVAELQAHETPAQALARADLALYAAKRSGRARTVLADPLDSPVTPAAAVGTD